MQCIIDHNADPAAHREVQSHGAPDGSWPRGQSALGMQFSKEPWQELFTYNRENFKFDQDQRIEREALRLEMQVKRFELFREAIFMLKHKSS